MIEPTETESKETLDAFVDAMLQIAEEARTTPSCCTPRRTMRRPAGWTRSRRPAISCFATARQRPPACE